VNGSTKTDLVKTPFKDSFCGECGESLCPYCGNCSCISKDGAMHDCELIADKVANYPNPFDPFLAAMTRKRRP
jgi:hypothetical protein